MASGLGSCGAGTVLGNQEDIRTHTGTPSMSGGGGVNPKPPKKQRRRCQRLWGHDFAKGTPKVAQGVVGPWVYAGYFGI